MMEGLAQVQRRFAAIPVKVRIAVRDEMGRQADKIVAAMRAAAPKDSLALANSIGWTWGRPPGGAMTIGRISNDAGGSRMTMTFYAGGTAETARRQSRSSGTRSRDVGRSGFFDTDNARFQEFGTAKMPANPFFYPVWRAMRSKARAAITRAMNKAIKAV
ncbi:HK97-gp10 family putative phage morphogenesis protein [uncultured Jannaschia sp.]|uniref:HK97-gp10 family putative phage morphogenesis protein n=1 Tax=uncultured Jannaschia sp. TaxID=293347 RepID=UPI00261D42EB|nr:HK97-gp10 family putative phage morphogenesis protein [uncultured Jannaschia sp.]